MTDTEYIEEAKDLLSYIGVDLTDDDISAGRYPNAVMKRALLCHVLNQKGLGPSRIGRIIGKDHATVIFLLTRYPGKGRKHSLHAANKFLKYKKQIPRLTKALSVKDKIRYWEDQKKLADKKIAILERQIHKTKKPPVDNHFAVSDSMLEYFTIFDKH